MKSPVKNIALRGETEVTKSAFGGVRSRAAGDECCDRRPILLSRLGAESANPTFKLSK